MNYPIAKIGDLSFQEPGSFKIGPFGSSLKKDELVSSGIPVIAIENVLPNNFIESYRKFITEKKYQELTQYTIQPGDIVVTTMGTIGRAAVVPENIGTAIIDSHLFRMRVDKLKVYPPYLCYAINGAPSVTNHLQQMSRGAIMEGLNTTILKESPIALPPLEEQQRIADLLARADRLRRLRRYARELGDTYLQSVFVEMFGDPIKNLKGWDKVEIENLIFDLRGGSPLEPEDFVDVGFPVLHKGAIKPWGEIELDSKKKTFTHDAFVKRYKRAVIDRKYVAVTLRDLVPTGPSIGLVSKLINSPYPEYILAQGAYAFLVDKKRLTADYLVALSNMPSFRKFLRTIAVGSTQIHIRTPIYTEIAVPLPPMNIQEQFADVVSRYERLRVQLTESERQAEMLFQSLLAQAFS